MPKRDKKLPGDVDPTDKAIIEALKIDGRMPNSKIAKECNISEGTVRRRLRRLLKSGIIDVVARPNSVKMGKSVRALIGVKAEPGKIREVAKELNDLGEIDWVMSTAGQLDIFAWAAFPTTHELGSFVKDVVGKVNGVRDTMTLINLDDENGGPGVTS